MNNNEVTIIIVFFYSWLLFNLSSADVTFHRDIV